MNLNIDFIIIDQVVRKLLMQIIDDIYTQK